MIDLQTLEVWFVTGSQHLYGAEAIAQVDEHSRTIARALDESAEIPVRVVFKPTLTTPDAITALCLDANAAKNCIGIITWMHTFSPAKMWIAGLKILQKPLAHLHTQYNVEIPWAEIDMDFMNLNQSAHGDREFGFIVSRMRRERKVVVGHWQESDVQRSLGVWARAAAGWHDAQGMKIARFGDNMREVAVTDGDKVEAQYRLGYSVNGYGIGDLVRVIDAISDAEVDRLVQEYLDQYEVVASLRPGGAQHESLRQSARIEAGLRAFLVDGGFSGFSDSFEVLHGMTQLPGMAVQRLMADGYGFAGEGDWKTAALVRTMKVMASGLEPGTSFMEDYTYHLATSGQKVLGSHMLEVCPSISVGKPRIEIHPLGIGGKPDPVRMVFDSQTGSAINASVMDMGNRFRMVVNQVDVVPTDEPLPKLPVARALWLPQPNLKIAAAAWIHAGGAHHTVYSLALTAEHMQDYADIAGIEFLLIDNETRLADFRKELHWNELYYALARGL